MTKTKHPFHYEGFSTPNGTIVPDDVFDLLMPELTESELRVLLYILRRTYGFKKNSDSISLSQMVQGIRTKDGRNDPGNAAVLIGLIGYLKINATRFIAAFKRLQISAFFAAQRVKKYVVAVFPQKVRFRIAGNNFS